MEVSQRFWLADLEDIKRGYIYETGSEEYTCLACGKTFSQGVIYPVDDLLVEAERAVRMHLRSEHGSMFEYLLEMDKRYTGLTEHQKEVLRLVHQGFNDQEIALRLNTGSTSTIRNQRFSFREKEKTAKAFLAIMGLLKDDAEERTRQKIKRPVPENRSDEEKVLSVYFRGGPDGALTRFPRKEGQRLIVLRHLAGRFQPGMKYTEKEVNQILREAYHDHVTLRRHLIDYGILDRLPDGSRYWVNPGKAAQDQISGQSDSERRRLKRDYLENPPPGGVYQIKNLANGRVLVSSSLNLSGAINRSRFELGRGVHPNRQLQQDWDRLGTDLFAFEVLESFAREDYTDSDFRERIAAAEVRWMEALSPYGDRGYNRE